MNLLPCPEPIVDRKALGSVRTSGEFVVAPVGGYQDLVSHLTIVTRFGVPFRRGCPTTPGLGVMFRHFDGGASKPDSQMRRSRSARGTLALPSLRIPADERAMDGTGLFV